MRNWLRPLTMNEIEKDADYMMVKDFVEKFEPAEGKSYKWVYEHAMRLYDQATEKARALDSKAENMLRYLAPSSGIIGLAVAWFVRGVGDALTFVLVGFGLFILLLAMMAIIGVLMPHQQALPPSVIDATKAVEHYDNEDLAKANLSSGIESTLSLMCKVTEVKARYLLFSYAFFIIAFGCLLGAVGLSMWHSHPS